MNPLRLLGRATQVWWQDWISILILSSVWLLLQLPLVTGPPATAMLYAMMGESRDGLYWGPAEAWAAFRRLFWPAWRWALVNLLVTGVVAVNLLTYTAQAGSLWLLLRLLWIGGLSLWLLVNLFYWPFYLVQEDQRLRNTFANSARFLLLHPLAALLLGIVCLVVLAVSLLTVLPVVLGTVGWVALVAVVAVQQSLAQARAREEAVAD